MNGPRPPLRLVHPAPPPVPKARYRPPLFTPEEEARLRAALKGARPLFGTWARLAEAMHVHPKHLQSVSGPKGRVCGTIAVRLAKVLGKPLDALTRPLADASTCPTCGAARGPT